MAVRVNIDLSKYNNILIKINKFVFLKLFICLKKKNKIKPIKK